MKERKKKTPADINVIAKYICDTTTEGATTIECVKEKNPAAVALGRLGGLKGGKARAESLSKKRRVEIAKEGAKARWKK